MLFGTGVFPCISRAADGIHPAGRIINFKGYVRTLPDGKAQEAIPTVGLELNPGAVVLTGGDGWASILMADETLIQLNRNTRFTLKAVDASAGWYGLRGVVPASAATSGGSVYQLDSGEMWLRNKNPGARIGLETPTVSAGIRGTEVNALIGTDESVTLSILEGMVEARNEYGSMTAGPGEMIYTAKGSAPEKRMLISPKDAVQWTLTLPPVDIRYAYPMVSHDPRILESEQQRLSSALMKNPTDRDQLLALARVYRDLGRLEDSLSFFRKVLKLNPDDSDAFSGIGWIALEQGSLVEALDLFERVKTPDALTMLGTAMTHTWNGDFEKADLLLSRGLSVYPGNAGFLFHRAQVRIAMRDLITASQLLGSLTQTNPDYGPGWSLLSIVMLARGDADTSAVLAAAQKGVRAAPDSPAAFLVLTYAYQAGFDLDKALSAANEALSIDPAYVPAMVARARLLFGTNRTDDAFKMIESAYKKAPEDPEVLNMKGFLQLAGRDGKGAIESFKSALNADPGMGEAHLGLALVHMRLGNIADAMEEITTAVLLEPRRSLFVSYWAKMLYQVKRFDRALQALDYAKKLDPLDPTPFLYEAIILRDLNRPTEAVAAINQAIRLNGNRAVYRSRFLMDRDLAVKNIDQTILFQDLGLMDWARSKALASVKTDYHNSAGHTFLAGSLLAMDDRLRSGSSENLLGLMLQQANLNSLNTFQDYTSFFEAPSLNGVLSGAAGNHGTYGGEAIVYGALPSADLAFNSIVDYGETDGWRDTNGSRTRGGGLSLKWDPSPKDGIMLLASHLKSNAKDRQTDPYEYDAPSLPDDQRENDSYRITLGYRRSLSPEADLFLMGKHMEFNQDSLSNTAFWLDKTEGIALFQTASDRMDLSSDQVQGHLLYRLQDHQLILGLLHQWRKRNVDNNSLYEYWLLYDGWWYDLYTDSDVTVQTVNDTYQSYYVQDIWHITSWLTLETALYYDILKNHNLYSAVEQQQEKVNPRLGLIFTPTPHDTLRLAGFRYLTPFTIDRLDPTDIAGIPLFRNDFENTVTEEYDLAWEHEWASGYVAINSFYLESETEEKNASGTVSRWPAQIKGIEPVWNQMLWQGFGLSLRYRFLDIENDYSSYKNREDHLTSATLNFLHPGGFFAGISQSFRKEHFKGSDRDTENIWLTDLALGYKFPGKRGVFRMDVKNLFDHQFNWVVDDMVFNGRNPSREILASISFYF
jgi:tetratricopeptide (TPR) repeat protein